MEKKNIVKKNTFVMGFMEIGCDVVVVRVRGVKKFLLTSILYRGTMYPRTRTTTTTTLREGYKMEKKSSVVKKLASRALADFCRERRYPYEVRELQEDLKFSLGITFGLIHGAHTVTPGGTEVFRAEWYIDGERVEDSVLVYHVYKGGHPLKNEYLIYLS